ncbi:hypothetical protein [Microbacterium suwonense]|uniref:Uncharacterized protein n=1 Tax=Microbacterium suwonense TaxID=683047 RepID=A0ABN6X5G5_9MICO|nr:hypothetical protein [Microbacterium suwonense]BDZ39937.1 hypothetical protein GCM10025863_25510 [Microbacterium suwonense]
MNFDEAADTITAVLLGDREFSTVSIGADESVTLDGTMERGAVIESEHRAGAERVAEGLRMAASRLRPAGELVTVTRQELAMWFEGRDGLEEATPKCQRCLVPLTPHPTAEAWTCPSCGALTLAQRYFASPVGWKSCQRFLSEEYTEMLGPSPRPA